MTVQSEERFRERLVDQLSFLRTSCERFDAGDKREAIRIATVMRVLFHDTTDRRGRPRSVSVLSHLNAKDRVSLFSSCDPPPDVIEYAGMGRVYMNVTKGYEVSRRIEPVLDDAAHPDVAVSVEDWWQMPVYVSRYDGRLKVVGSLSDITGKDWIIRRKNIILGAVNKDGGAHVDAELAPDYEQLAASGALRMFEMEIVLANGETVRLPPLKDAHLVFLRQMGHEVLQSPDLWTLTSMEHMRTESEELRDKIAHYYSAYYRELRRQLEGRSFSISTVPSHLMPWKKVVYVMETRDGHFVVDHISGSSTTYFDSYEDYIQVVPRRYFSLRDITGAVHEEGTAMRVSPMLERRIFGKRIGDEGFDEVQKGDYLERRDVITRAKVRELIRDEARKEAQEDIRLYLT